MGSVLISGSTATGVLNNPLYTVHQLHVPLQSAHGCEATAAVPARQRVLRLVHPLPVLPQVGRVGELPVARRTAVRLHARMDDHVGAEVGHALEAPAAHAAHVSRGVGAQVDVAPVLGQVGLVAEPLVALRARVRPLSVVDPQVRGQVFAPHEALAAELAHVGAFAGVGPLVHHNVHPEELGRGQAPWFKNKKVT